MEIYTLRRYARAKQAVAEMKDESQVDPWSLDVVFAVQAKLLKLRQAEEDGEE